MTKKKPDTKKNVPAKKSKEIIKSPKSDIPDEQKCLKTSVKNKDGVNCCSLVLEKEDVVVLARSTGCKVYYASKALIKIGIDAVMSGTDEPEIVEAANNDYLAMMAELKPQDAFEGMLVSQMSVTYLQAMDCLRMANNTKNSKSLERYQNQGIKLMRLYNYQLESLDKHRRKGNQKMTVEHVHVHKGGQAIVGNVTQGGEGASNEM